MEGQLGDHFDLAPARLELGGHLAHAVVAIAEPDVLLGAQHHPPVLAHDRDPADRPPTVRLVAIVERLAGAALRHPREDDGVVDALHRQVGFHGVGPRRHGQHGDGGDAGGGRTESARQPSAQHSRPRRHRPRRLPCAQPGRTPAGGMHVDLQGQAALITGGARMGDAVAGGAGRGRRRRRRSPTGCRPTRPSAPRRSVRGRGRRALHAPRRPRRSARVPDRGQRSRGGLRPARHPGEHGLALQARCRSTTRTKTTGTASCRSICGPRSCAAGRRCRTCARRAAAGS